MPRLALTAGAIALLVSTSGSSQTLDPHLDASLVPAGCAACHVGHGVSSSPMLPNELKNVCLSCHDTRERSDEQVRKGTLAPEARPALLGATLAAPYTHPLSAEAVSRFDPDAVTCTSCHSPHRLGVEQQGASLQGISRVSPRNPRQFEYQLCESCHGNSDTKTRDPNDLSRLFDPTSRSFHPVHSPANDATPSSRAKISRQLINCTDCHGNSDPGGPRGPHGSGVVKVLAARLEIADGATESETTYALCYACHRRETILAPDSLFPLHRLHVVDEQTACSTCHSAHGSPNNRALIRFGEEGQTTGVAGSAGAGKLEFQSDTPGSGLCYLSCHGVDHSPAGYGAEASLAEALQIPSQTTWPAGGLETEPLEPEGSEASRPTRGARDSGDAWPPPPR